MRDDTNEALSWGSVADSTVLDADDPLPMMEPDEVMLVDDARAERKIRWTERTPRERADIISGPRVIEGRVIDLGMARPDPTRNARPAKRRPHAEIATRSPSTLGSAVRVILRIGVGSTLVLAGAVIGMHIGATARLLLWLLERAAQ